MKIVAMLVNYTCKKSSLSFIELFYPKEINTWNIELLSICI